MCGRYMTEAFSDIISRSANIENIAAGILGVRDSKSRFMLVEGREGKLRKLRC